MSKSDQQQVKRLLEGDERALREFFDEYFDRLYRFALSRLRHDSGIAPSLAEEAAQRTLCRAVRRLDSFRGEASLFSWLAAICRNELADLLEIAQRDAARHVSLDSDRAASQHPGDIRQQPEEQTAAGERVEHIASVLRQLPGRYGEMLRWKYLDDLSTEAIAERLSMSHDAAQSALQRARAAFKSAALAAGLEV